MREGQSPSVLIVEDDEGIGGGLLRAVRGEGYAATWCRTAAAALEHPLAEVDLILLDLGLPDLDGLELCRQFRAALPTTPIVILTARGSEADVVVGLDAGADDYLVKPFRLAELFARLRAHVRRQVSDDGSARLAVGDLVLDPAARRVTVGTAEVDLRPKEFDLLEVLMRNAGKALSRERAMELVWDEHWFGSTKTLDVHIAALRQRLGESGPDGSRITTLRGVGYRLELPTGEAP
jgi:DNA-binding response OmpR family regulator